jgi:PAS domain S-box-containing protein
MKAELTPNQELDLETLCVSITERAPLPMASVEGATRIVRYGNPAFCQLMGQPLDQLVGKSFDELLPAKDRCVTLLERVFRTGRPESYTEQDASKPHPVFWSYTIWPVEAEEGLIGVMIQVTETAKLHGETVAMNEALVIGSVRQHELAAEAEDFNRLLRAEIQERIWAEEALRASEERFRVLFDFGPVAICSCDKRGVIQDYNQRASELWGRDPRRGHDGERFAEAIPLCDGNGRLLPDPESPIIEVLTGRAFLKDENVFIQRPDGTRIAAVATFVPMKDRQGEIVGAITAFYDVTERRLLEQSLIGRAEDLVRADRSKNEFLAMLAHELRNPLAPLRNVAEILQVADVTVEAREQAQGILLRQIENMSRMVDDLLDVSRITHGKVHLRKEVVRLDEVTTAAAAVATPGMEARRQKLSISLPASPIYLSADATRLEQVLANLLGNASKYSDMEAHISLSAEVDHPAGEEASQVILRVRDNGLGIASDMLPYIYDLFVQSPRALDRPYGGLGVGLTLVQRLVQLHGGSVEAHSEGLGRGSEFVVRLPILSAAPAASSASPPTAPTRESRLRILIVDDNADSARSMSSLQRLRGHETRMAFSGPEAVTVAAEFSPELVLLDIGLPGIDGFEVARRLRAMPKTADALIVAMTGYGSEEDRATAKEAGFDEYLVKPINLDFLRDWLRRRSADPSR